ncbi:ATP-dependent DNA helicase RecG [Shewanella xiamenensis]|uniref:ATP-dependent DNA helicase RecG n=1 Tax=Shewanella xiamenensis TaxID=332186 RepID=UPI000DB52804|nr:ATP-dependent DNA helicase RecG [Shewanella xiamenensis]PZP29522.1 MAG: ATP-dependent DNA helicase RecG [Shewanella oneidensis]MBW0279853.1 ATP-dependent DNA helicase RecG [Shewanella xiamenensis]MCT8872361.1 ATP-dependent DNA helicase RecG [Shewanella xiamenensis]MCT8876276.1 ATP-dependent DNA helicase RecG [Shewanella xiamenensis]UWH43906.1 ATP-dependent DNA helicase RecG [Shewanella xiamenensis]
MQQLDLVPITELKGVAKRVAEKLAKLGITTVQDLLFHLPLRYEDRTQIYPIAALMPGNYGTIEAEIQSTQILQGRKRMLVCNVRDDTGSMSLRFFNFSMAQRNAMQNGLMIRAYGEIRRGSHQAEIVHPEYKIVYPGEDIHLSDTLTPIYPTTEGLKQASWIKLTEQALELLEDDGLTELLPAHLQPNNMSLKQALQTLHRPHAGISQFDLELGQHPAQQRLVQEELLAHNLSMLRLRQRSNLDAAVTMHATGQLLKPFLASLPFKPTGAQQRVVAEIGKDLAQPHPMMRLVQGDVGSGKTLVAALAALQAIENGYQVAMMAPTELLAEQHAANFAAWFEPLGLKVGWLAGKLKGKARAQSLADIESGAAQMVIGTHAIFQQQVIFHRLALIIIDEQHRFGVHQRMGLREKGINQGFHPHQLIMTATPIPRTLAMTAYADLDTSIIDELPPGRTPVTTVAIPDSRRNEVLERVRNSVITDKRQAYWVCTLIEESEVLECQAAEDTAEELRLSLPELTIGLVHGRMKSAEKQQIMADFKAGTINLLVATTVIEVGVDVPNSSLMIIENPERLGLAQLHQLRGRVGRGAVASHCVLLYKAPLSQTASQRLNVLRQSNDGFVIAQKDLEIRGPGEVLGTKQTGLAELKIADLVRDQALIPHIQKLANHVMSQAPDAVDAIIHRWLGHRQQYVQA